MVGIVFLLLLLGQSAPLTPCIDSICPPLWPKRKLPYDEIDQMGSVLLGKDPKSGCSCREVPHQFAVCFGHDQCHHFPKNLPITATTLKLTQTGITALENGDLHRLPHLEMLIVEVNDNLSEIHAGFFANMTKLWRLSISNNANLTRLNRGTFEGLVNLKELVLVKNGFMSLAEVTLALGKAALPRLQKLELSENSFIEIHKGDFEPMNGSGVEELNLILCRIEAMAAEVFVPLKNLMVLRLGQNSFNVSVLAQVIAVTVEHAPLKALNLYSIGLRKRPPKILMDAIAKSNITTLSLARNQFETITAQSFPSMLNLQVLDLSEVLALTIDNDSFVSLPGLRNLRLNGNRLTSIPEGVLLEQLTCLDLQQNFGDFHPSYFRLYGRKFGNMKNLRTLNLSFNRIGAVYNSSFFGLSSLRVLGLKNATIYYIANGSFSMLSELIFLNLDDNHFAKNIPLASPIFQGLERLQVLLLAGCGISIIKDNPFRDLKALKHLGLQRNKLTSIDGFDSLRNLATLDLSANNLVPWQRRVFENNPNLQTIRANENKFTHLTAAMLQDFHNLTVLQLEGNPFTCNCLMMWLKGAGEDTDNHCDFPGSPANLTVAQFLRKYPECEYEQKFPMLIPIAVITILIILVTVCLILVYHYRWHCLYVNCNVRIGNLDEDSSSYSNFVYDAFVCYSHEDSNFVNRLVAMLEKYAPYLRLCVYERDFQIGTFISDNVVESVARSRKTLLIISNSYVKSKWCRWESHFAADLRLRSQRVDGSLVLVKLGPVSETHLTPMLKFLLKTRIYLPWDEEEKKQKEFWDKLRCALAPPPEVHENTHL